jgi:hypothetical protein
VSPPVYPGLVIASAGRAPWVRRSLRPRRQTQEPGLCGRRAARGCRRPGRTTVVGKSLAGVVGGRSVLVATERAEFRPGTDVAGARGFGHELDGALLRAVVGGRVAEPAGRRNQGWRGGVQDSAFAYAARDRQRLNRGPSARILLGESDRAELAPAQLDRAIASSPTRS